MGKNKCCCSNATFETVDITPVGMMDKKFFTRCTQCGLVVVGSEHRIEKKSTGKCSVLQFVREALGNVK